jgi:hypothetical protein
MKDNTTELTDTTINIKVRTGVMHRNKADEAHTRNDFTSYYIGAINYFIRVALDAQSHLEMETNSIVLRNDAIFRENLQFLIQIQEAFAEWMPNYSNGIADGEKGKFSDAPKVEQPAESQELDKLAVHFSAIMKDPLTPPEIYNVLGEYFVHVTADTDSPEWILGNLKKMQGGAI